MLEGEVVFVTFVESAEDVDLILGVVAAGADAGGNLVVGVEVGSSEDHVLGLFMPVVNFVEDGGLIGLVHELEQEALQKVVLCGPEQQQVVLSLVVVPLRKYE